MSSLTRQVAPVSLVGQNLQAFLEQSTPFSDGEDINYPFKGPKQVRFDIRHSLRNIIQADEEGIDLGEIEINSDIRRVSR